MGSGPNPFARCVPEKTLGIHLLEMARTVEVQKGPLMVEFGGAVSNDDVTWISLTLRQHLLPRHIIS